MQTATSNTRGRIHILRGRLLSDAVWTAAGQIATAIGMILGIRVLTELVSPETFGTASLCLGAATLAMNVGCTPLTQAAIHFYPTMASGSAVGSMRDSVRHSLARIGVWGLPFVVVTMIIVGVMFGAEAALTVGLVAALLVCDCLRSVELTFLNAGRAHKQYALLASADACLRPFVAAAAVFLAGESTVMVLTGYLMTSATILWLFLRKIRNATTEESGPFREPDSDLDKKMWRYALPLIPLGLMNWANGLGDRYVIGSTLGVADAGVYAAVYGLASRPFLMLGQSVELAMRPVYQGAVSGQRRGQANRLLAAWVCVIGIAGLLMLATMTFWSTELVDLLLADEYRRAAELLPWIGAGYCLLAISDVFTRVSFAHGNTRWVLAIVACAAATGVIATFIGARLWGLVGAAMAVPVYFGVQLAVAIVAARASYQKSAERMQ